MFQNVIFDWSGVICDDTYAVYQADMDVFKAFGASVISFEEFKREWEMPFMNFLHKYLPDITIEQQGSVFKQSIAKYNQDKIFNGIDKSIKKFFDRKINLFIVSSDPGILLEQINLFGLSGLFKEVIYKVHDKTEPVKELVKKYELNLEETVFIGDTNHEIEAGKSVGIKTGAVTWGTFNEEKLKSYKPDYIFHDLIELEKAILS
jgi:phosphoglycolate phosphatase